MKKLPITLLSFITGLFISFTTTGQTTVLRPGNMVIVAYDNIIDNVGSDAIVVKTMVEIAQGTTFGITDASYVADDDYWTFTGTDVPRVEFEYTSTTPIEVATDIAFYIHPSTGAVQIYQGLANISGRFQRTMTGDYNGLLHNATSSQAYFYQGDWEVDGQ